MRDARRRKERKRKGRETRRMKRGEEL